MTERWILESADQLEQRLADAVAPLGLQLKLRDEQKLYDEYLDTNRHGLAKDDVSLVLRKTDDGSELRWAVAVDDEGSRRDVLVARQRVPDSRGTRRPWPAGKVIRRLRDRVGDEPLGVVACVTRIRRPWLVQRDTQVVAEVRAELNVLEAAGEAPVETLQYLELSLIGRYECADDFVAVLRNFTESLVLVSPRLSEGQRVRQLAGVTSKPGKKKSKSARHSLLDAASAWMLDYFRQQLAALRFHEARAWEGIDPEGVHQMRVATRRMRAALKAFAREFVEEASVSVPDDLRWLAAVLGAVRDCDVAQLDMPGLRSQLSASARHAIEPFLEHMTSGREEARRELLAALSSERYAKLLNELEAGVGRHAARGFLKLKSPAMTVREMTRRLLKRRLKKVVDGCLQLTEQSSPAEYHQLRIQGKRLRYLLEMLAPACGKRLKPLITATKTMQDILGEHQDACVGVDRVDAFAQQTPMRVANRPLLLALGELRGCYDQQARTRRHAFHAAQDCFRDPQLNVQLRALLESE